MVMEFTGRKIVVRDGVTLIRFHPAIVLEGLPWLDLTPMTTLQQELMFDFDIDQAIQISLAAMGVVTMPDGVMIVDHNTRRGRFIWGSDWESLANQLVTSGYAKPHTGKKYKGFGKKSDYQLSIIFSSTPFWQRMGVSF